MPLFLESLPILNTYAKKEEEKKRKKWLLQSISQSIDFRRKAIYLIYVRLTMLDTMHKHINRYSTLASSHHFSFSIYWNRSIDVNWFNYIEINCLFFYRWGLKEGGKQWALNSSNSIMNRNMNEQSINVLSIRTMLHEHATTISWIWFDPMCVWTSKNLFRRRQTNKRINKRWKCVFEQTVQKMKIHSSHTHDYVWQRMEIYRAEQRSKLWLSCHDLSPICTNAYVVSTPLYHIVSSYYMTVFSTHQKIDMLKACTTLELQPNTHNWFSKETRIE